MFDNLFVSLTTFLLHKGSASAFFALQWPMISRGQAPRCLLVAPRTCVDFKSSQERPKMVPMLPRTTCRTACLHHSIASPTISTEYNCLAVSACMLWWQHATRECTRNLAQWDERRNNTMSVCTCKLLHHCKRRVDRAWSSNREFTRSSLINTSESKKQ